MSTSECMNRKARRGGKLKLIFRMVKGIGSMTVYRVAVYTVYVG